MLKKTLMYGEIHEQSQAVAHTLEINLPKVKTIVEDVKKAGITNVILTARGSSDNVCVYFKYLCEIYCGIPCGFSAPSVSTIYGGKLKLQNTLVIAVSQSGMGLDILQVVDDANRCGAMTVAITNNPNSLLAKASKFDLFLDCGEEKSVAATKTFTTQMAVLGLLVAEWADNDYLRNCLKQVPQLLTDTLKNEDKIEALAEQSKDFYDCYMLARGLNYVSALEAALKLQETTYIKSKAYSISDFYHGPFAVVDKTQNIFVLHGYGLTNMDSYTMFEHLTNTGANVIVISNDAYFEDYDKVLFVPRCEECISPFAIIETMQLFSNDLALIKGNDPDKPRGLKKVTVTR
jgi:Glucosamine 6-phosphate synthetase, contains amidotransferase and phosphosugar isomerase domains